MLEDNVRNEIVSLSTLILILLSRARYIFKQKSLKNELYSKNTQTRHPIPLLQLFVRKNTIETRPIYYNIPCNIFRICTMFILITVLEPNL